VGKRVRKSGREKAREGDGGQGKGTLARSGYYSAKLPRGFAIR